MDIMNRDKFITIVEQGYGCSHCRHFNRDSAGYLQCNNLQYIEIEENFLCIEFELNGEYTYLNKIED